MATIGPIIENCYIQKCLGKPRGLVFTPSEFRHLFEKEITIPFIGSIKTHTFHLRKIPGYRSSEIFNTLQSSKTEDHRYKKLFQSSITFLKHTHLII